MSAKLSASGWAAQAHRAGLKASCLPPPAAEPGVLAAGREEVSEAVDADKPQC